MYNGFSTCMALEDALLARGKRVDTSSYGCILPAIIVRPPKWVPLIVAVCIGHLVVTRVFAQLEHFLTLYETEA